MKLIDKINHLRLSAAFLFDLGKSQKHSPDQIANNIRPLSEKLNNQIESSSIAERVLAVKSLENQVEAHERDKQFFNEKIEDCKYHIQNIKNSLVNNLNAQEKTSMIEDGHTLTMIDGILNIR